MFKKLILVLIYAWLIFDAAFAILGGAANSGDYFTLIGLIIIGLLEIVRRVTRKE